MNAFFSAGATGLLMAVGLGLAGMMNPRKVQGFLDLSGRWDPSLGLVMGGALLVTLISYPFIFKRKAPLFETQFALPATNTHMDFKLIAGAVLFGAGWALAGLCPGPALANLSSLNPGVLSFTVMMLVGFMAYQRLSLFEIQHEKLPAAEQQKKTEAFCAEECVVD